MYAVFAGDVYYAKGGMNDLKGTFDTQEAAHAECVRRENTKRQQDEWEWWQIINMPSWMIVNESEAKPHGND